MQLSVKTPPDLTVPILEKCAVMEARFPSSFAMNCVWQCLKAMEHPHHPFHPIEMVTDYYRAIGRDAEVHPSSQEPSGILLELAEKDRAKQVKNAARRLAEFRAQIKKEPPPKHLHLKISEGIDDLPQRIKDKAIWLRMSPNALVTACLRDCIAAMDDPKKAVVPFPIIVDFWAISHAKTRPKPTDVIDAMVIKNIDGTLRQRSVPILDTIIRLTLAEMWDVTLEQILREADAINDKREFKR
jgi:hypothetical protein